MEINLAQACSAVVAFEVLVCESAEALMNSSFPLYKIQLPRLREDFLSKENHGRIHVVPQWENT